MAAPNVVSILYGTDRAERLSTEGFDYSGERASRLELGEARVSVPKSHVPGRLERPGDILFVVRRPEDPAKHFVLAGPPRLLSESQFAAEAKALATRGAALLYLHGYNQTFDFGLYRTAQLAYDFQIKGPVFYYSFPSRADPRQYIYDVNSDEQAVPYLEHYLNVIFQEAGVRQIDIIAHSRGNDLLLRTLNVMSLSHELPAQCCGELILASPDVDRDLARNIVPLILPHFNTTTLYVNDKDRALWISKTIAGRIPRLGELQENKAPVILAGMDSIDASAAKQAFFDFDHDEYVDDSILLKDIERLVERGYAPPDQRSSAFILRHFQAGQYWELRP